MHISSTFLNSKIAQRIALILFLAAFIPTALITGLTHNTVNKLTASYAHEKLVANSKSYAISTFSNLMLARNSLYIVSDAMDSTSLVFSHALVEHNKAIFNSLLIATAEGLVQDKTSGAEYYAQSQHKNLILVTIKEAPPNKARLLVLPVSTKNAKPIIALILPRYAGATIKSLLIAEINPDFLWGNVEDYPSDIGVCAYQLDGKSESLLFCSAEENPTFKDHAHPENVADWELFLRGEFQDSAWRFVVKRQYPLSDSPLNNFSNGYGYIGATVFSLLLVALLSLIQIRRTMVPLERLVEGARNISKGEFTQVKVAGKSEFVELADSFNGMSASIKRQLETMQSLSSIDFDMATKLDVDQLIKQIITRTQSLMPATVVSITRLEEVSSHEAQCSISISEKISLSSPRLTIPNQEISVIKSYGVGQFVLCEKEDPFIHRSFLADLGTKYCWIMPIFWQGKICAFLSVADELPLPQDSPNWAEIRELAGRVGIAISAQQREDKLLAQAQYDSLTGLPNRILLQDRLRQAMEHSDRSGEPFLVAFIDLDRFKFINDSLGHKTGDKLLCEVSRRLEQAVRDTDTVARFGGDEFIVILQGEMDDNFRIGILQRLIQEVGTPFVVDSHQTITTCSIGVSVYPADATDADTLLSSADIAMYRAKELGKNNFQFFMQSMNEKIANHLRLETNLRKALEQNEFIVHYQPKVDLISKLIVGMEALIRWDNPELGFVSPANFIPLAEESGLIVPIGEWVLKIACQQAVAWQKAGYGTLLMSVNLSARQFQQKNLVKTIAAILIETGLEAKCLELELTESLVMGDMETALKTMHEIKSLGVHLSIDDFGTGYSSLSYLKKLPIDTLKIDKSFTDDIVLHSDAAPIAASIISLAKNLKLKVVAEGVESSEQVKYLTAHGCDEIQGYYFSKPATATSIEELLKINPAFNSPSLKLVETH
jgi:diguanylate cyclase (GGDEF)-like protein